MLIQLMRGGAHRIFGSALSIVGGTKLVALALVVVGGLVMSNKVSRLQLESAQSEVSTVQDENTDLRELTNRLNTAMYMLRHHETKRVERDNRNDFALETLRRDDHYTLDLAVPPGVLRVLRPPIRASPEAPADTP